jgi:hypothetical protein
MSSALFLICFAVFVLAMIVIGWWVTRKQTAGDDLLLGGRRVPFFLTLGTTIATMVGTGSSMGAVGEGYQAGWVGMLLGIALYFQFDPALSQHWGGSVIPAVVVSVTLGIAVARSMPSDRLSHKQALALLESQRKDSAR